MTNPLKSGQYFSYGSRLREYAAQVFGNAANVTDIYKQFFILSGAWRPVGVFLISRLHAMSRL